MRIKLFHASTMADAMRQVRSELGDDALILGNRRVADGVEITAALEPHAAAQPPVRLPPAVQPPPEDPRAQWVNQMTRRIAVLRFGPLDWSRPIMLVGMPGAGKTLTAAKLATRLVRQGEWPMMITADGDRAGATEQLAAFTRILELDLVLAENPLTMARILATRPAGRKAIIDMAGLNPFDREQKELLITYAVTADANLVWVLPAGLDPEDAEEMAEAFLGMGVRQMIATKLDLTRRLEGVLRAAEAGGFTLTDAGTGAHVVDGIIGLDAQHLIGRCADAVPQRKTRQAA